MNVQKIVFPSVRPPIRFTRPVLIPRGFWTWEGRDIHSNFVLRDDSGTYYIYYNGRRSKRSGIGVAQSADGVAFSKHVANPILKPEKGTWEGDALWKCYVLKPRSNDWRMWYGGIQGGIGQVGYATSFDGFSWTRFAGNPVLRPGTHGAWDEAGIYSFRVAYDILTNQFFGLYGVNGYIGLAKSSNGIIWKKFAQNPILKPLPDSWEEREIFPMCLVKRNGLWVLFYEGNSRETKWQVGVAYSLDLVEWRRDPRNPILTAGPRGNFDGEAVSDPSAIISNDKINLYYGAFNKWWERSVGLVLFPLKNRIGDYFRSFSQPWNNTIIKVGRFSDGIFCQGYKKKIYFLADVAGRLTIQVPRSNRAWRIYDTLSIPVKTLLSYTVTPEEKAIRISYDKTATVHARWELYYDQTVDSNV